MFKKQKKIPSTTWAERVNNWEWKRRKEWMNEKKGEEKWWKEWRNRRRKEWWGGKLHDEMLKEYFDHYFWPIGIKNNFVGGVNSSLLTMIAHNYFIWISFLYLSSCNYSLKDGLGKTYNLQISYIESFMMNKIVFMEF